MPWPLIWKVGEPSLYCLICWIGDDSICIQFLKIIPRKLGATLKNEFLDVVHFLQAKIDLHTDIQWYGIPLIFKAQPLHAHSPGHTLYTLLCHATKVIFLVHNLKGIFVLIETLVYLFSAWFEPSPTKLEAVSSRKSKTWIWGYIYACTHLCVCRHTYILFKCTKEFLFSFYHVYIYSYPSMWIYLWIWDNQTIRCIVTWLGNTKQLKLASSASLLVYKFIYLLIFLSSCLHLLWRIKNTQK